MQPLISLFNENRSGKQVGIYSVCSANATVLEAALLQAKQDDSLVVIEATANQVNQFGGYTGMKAADFVPFVNQIADKVGFSTENIILGGDHLGPVCWCDEKAESALLKAKDLIVEYAEAGFKKIHLDTSMPCSDDPDVLTDDIVASRAAELCEAAEQAAINKFGKSDIVYIVGTEVPPPGGATEDMSGLQVTPVNEVQMTYDAHKVAFTQQGLQDAWQRVVGLVVQPGVEFDHHDVHDYDAQKAKDLSELVLSFPNLVYEAHSTDYQKDAAYQELVRDHFAILKVGPQLTFAYGEALFALSHIESELVHESKSAKLIDFAEKLMLAEPKNWSKYYPEEQGLLCRRYSYSDRIRYYWNNPQLEAVVEQLLTNLSEVEIPLSLLSQYMPLQYQAVRNGELECEPHSLVLYHIMRVTDSYARACKEVK